MLENHVIDRVVEEGLQELTEGFHTPDNLCKARGRLQGLVDCRGKTSQQILELLEVCHTNTCQLRNQCFGAVGEILEGAPLEEFWTSRHREMAVEWVLDVVSVGKFIQGHPTLVTPSLRGMMKFMDLQREEQPLAA